MSDHPWMPSIIDDDECEICDDAALPYEENSDYPLCPVDGMAVATDCSIDDFEISAKAERIGEERKVQAGVVKDIGLCYTQNCEHTSFPRVKSSMWDFPNFGKKVVNSCTACAVRSFFYNTELLSTDEWLIDLRLEFNSDLGLG